MLKVLPSLNWMTKNFEQAKFPFALEKSAKVLQLLEYIVDEPEHMLEMGSILYILVMCCVLHNLVKTRVFPDLPG